MHDNLHLPQSGPKVLVVEADYFALTTRIDPNVIFWPPGFAEEKAIIPHSVRFLWISEYTDKRVRINILRQVEKRNDLTVWKCPVGELCRRIDSFWKFSWNRSPLSPVMPDKSGIDESVYVANQPELISFDQNTLFSRFIGDMALVRVAAENSSNPKIKSEDPAEINNDSSLSPELDGIRKFDMQRRIERAKSKRLMLLKKIGKRHQSRQQSANGNNNKALRPKNALEFLEQLSVLEKKIYETRYGINNGCKERSVSEVAALFLLDEPNVLVLLESALQKIQVHKIIPQKPNLLSKFDEIGIGEF